MKSHLTETTKHEASLGTVYDFNKQILIQQEPLTEEKLNDAKIKLETWFNWAIDGYAMLLCRERYDFTVFHLYENQNPYPPAVAASELIDVLKNRGQILSIEKDNETMNNAWEIWLKIEDEAFAYYLFRCDDWVIQC